MKKIVNSILLTLCFIALLVAFKMDALSLGSIELETNKNGFSAKICFTGGSNGIKNDSSLACKQKDEESQSR